MKSQFSKAFVGVFAVIALGFGLQAHAASLTNAQIQAVVQLLQSFNVDSTTINYVTLSLGGGSGVTPTPVPTPSPTPIPAPGGTCGQLTYNLYRGMTDTNTQGQVSVLQQMLGLNATGYFGTLTQQALAKFQANHNIPPIGVMGPITRQALMQSCLHPTPAPGPTPTPIGGISFTFNVPFAVSVGQIVTESGQGQLTVQVLSVSNTTAQVTLGQNCQRGTQCFYYPQQTFTMTTGQQVSFQGYTVTLNSVGTLGATFTAANSQMATNVLTASPNAGVAPLSVTFTGNANAGCNGGTFELAYGDGQWNTVSIPADACNGQFTQAHTYTAAGTYTATVFQYMACLHSSPRCMIAQPAPLGTATVVVTGSGTPSAPVIYSITPTQGSVGTQVTIVGNSFTADNVVHFGMGGTQHVASSNNGTTIVFTIPQAVGPCDLVTQGQQICAAVLQLVTEGSYNVSVSNTLGQSGTQNFTVVGSKNTGTFSITAPMTGQSFNRGQDMVISWNRGSIPASASVILDLYTEAGTKVGTIAIASTATQSTWHIPGFPQNYMCTMQYPNGLCGTSIPTGKYYVKGTASSDGFSANATQYGSAQSGLFTIVQTGSLTPTPLAVPTNVTASIASMTFAPTLMTIVAGATVTWTNTDSVPHTVTSDTGSFASQVLLQGQSYSYTFPSAGTFTYHCEVHPSMRGTVVVAQ